MVTGLQQGIYLRVSLVVFSSGKQLTSRKWPNVAVIDRNNEIKFIRKGAENEFQA